MFRRGHVDNDEVLIRHETRGVRMGGWDVSLRTEKWCLSMPLKIDIRCREDRGAGQTQKFAMDACRPAPKKKKVRMLHNQNWVCQRTVGTV